MELTNKERILLEDQLRVEYICMNKYRAYAAQAVDPEIKYLFDLVAKQEEQHANTIKMLLQQGGFNPPKQQ
ncbi:ferritin-like domain-containing protein [Caldicoprobacter algeriensis]|uniref:ferritin-like domain-containing protein n=1 Tax=Caldicoprobacter algeriensis TaxID=699281 RepID=UPI002079E8C8|nr:ferritin-like domain-containing protein [Caldicoprobacter algeriensis]MCM8901642.1 ferritin-like domain-containing protein [Caldicoprobacter algeriensis]